MVLLRLLLLLVFLDDSTISEKSCNTPAAEPKEEVGGLGKKNQLNIHQLLHKKVHNRPVLLTNHVFLKILFGFSLWFLSQVKYILVDGAWSTNATALTIHGEFPTPSGSSRSPHGTSLPLAPQEIVVHHLPKVRSLVVRPNKKGESEN